VDSRNRLCIKQTTARYSNTNSSWLSGGQEIPWFLFCSKVYYSVHITYHWLVSWATWIHFLRVPTLDLGSVVEIHNLVEKFSQGRSKVADDARPGAEVAETTVKWLLCCGFRRAGKAMGQVYHCLWRIYREILLNAFFPGTNITCFTFYIHLWPIYWLSLVSRESEGDESNRSLALLWKYREKQQSGTKGSSAGIEPGTSRTQGNTVTPGRNLIWWLCLYNTKGSVSRSHNPIVTSQLWKETKDRFQEAP
jgi:hypothetical protein